jgi:hypothetical protein
MKLAIEVEQKTLTAQICHDSAEKKREHRRWQLTALLIVPIGRSGQFSDAAQLLREVIHRTHTKLQPVSDQVGPVFDPLFF